MKIGQLKKHAKTHCQQVGKSLKITSESGFIIFSDYDVFLMKFEKVAKITPHGCPGLEMAPKRHPKGFQKAPKRCPESMKVTSKRHPQGIRIR